MGKPLAVFPRSPTKEYYRNRTPCFFLRYSTISARKKRTRRWSRCSQQTCLGHSSLLHPRTMTVTIVPKLFSEICCTVQLRLETPLTLSPVFTSGKNKQSLSYLHVVKGEFLTADPFSKKRSNYFSKQALVHHT